MRPLDGITVVTLEKNAIAAPFCTRASDPVPALGQHTDAILAELGWSAIEIKHLREEGAI